MNYELTDVTHSKLIEYVTKGHIAKAVENGPVDQVLAGLLFLKAKTKIHFTKSK